MNTGSALFDSVLVANRGEIALRVMRTARSMGYRVVAVYSQADAHSPHVACADEAVLIGPAPAARSYLDSSKIIEAAVASGAGAIHPGYGFLSENAEFARLCGEAGLVFVGPSPEAIALMSDKAAARRQMISAGVRCVPGYEGEDQSAAAFAAAATEIEYPVMVKAAAGGGGRGLRLVTQAEDLESALELARGEAENAFGDGALILEKAIMRPRHVEIQILGDQHGALIYLGERDCSIQRRHQKIIEEAPCPVMTPRLREQMGQAAVKAAASVRYASAGTVEFLLDEQGSFYFLEMNTRLQVEHPVTEMITGLDLVALQLKVASGEPLDIAQEDVAFQGHAIEARLYAEDPTNDFLPASGFVELWHPPAGVGIRVDDGIRSGIEISPHYDSMVAKITACGEDRGMARERLVRALKETALFGPASNRDFLIKALQHPVFAGGEADTSFVGKFFDSEPTAPGPTASEGAAAAILQFTALRQVGQEAATSLPGALLNWTSAAPLATPFDYTAQGEHAEYTVVPAGPADYRVAIGDQILVVHLEQFEPPRARLRIGAQTHDVIFKAGDRGHIWLSIDGRTLSLVDRNRLPGSNDQIEWGGVAAVAAGVAAVAAGVAAVATMHGMLVEVSVAPGAKVKRGDRLAVIEAMKMQHEVLAQAAGEVISVCVAANSQIAAGDLIVEIQAE